MATVVLHPYRKGYRPADQAATWEGLAEVERDLGVQVCHVEMKGETSYANAINALWGLGKDVVIVEHDIVPKTCHLTELELCPEPYCAFDYIGVEAKLWSRFGWGAGIGLSRVRAAAQDAIVRRPRLMQVAWADVAYQMSLVLPDVHVHWPPVDHHHVY